MSPERRIMHASWGRMQCPLTRPYDLSFTRLVDFDVIWVCITDDLGGIGVGEAIALPGYSHETADDVAKAVAELLQGETGASVSDLQRRSRNIWHGHPFAASAVMTALDFPELVDKHAPGFSFPLNAPVSGDAPLDELRQSIEHHLQCGYNFIKAKVGRDIERESKVARALLSGQFERPFKAVFDANQGYSVKNALRFAGVLAATSGERLLWLEQPVDRADWRAMAIVCEKAGAPVVLDEAIIEMADVDRAAEIGAVGVKLKLVKNFGPRNTLDMARRARELGLMVVLGNGVSTDIGNLAEALTLEAGAGLFSEPSECNGFVKLEAPLMQQAISVSPRGGVCVGQTSEAIRATVRGFRQRLGDNSTAVCQNWGALP